MKRKNELWSGLFFLFFLLVTKRLYGKEWEWSIGQKKTCRKKQHVEIDDMKEMSDLFCSKAAVGGNYNSTRDNDMIERLCRRVLKEEKRYLKKEEQMRNYAKTKDGTFAIYQGKKYTSGIDQNGKVILRSTDIEDLENGFEKCEPFKYGKQEKLVVCMKRVDPQEIEKYYRTYTIAYYCGFNFGVADENEQKVLIMAVDFPNWRDLGMTSTPYRGVCKKWVNKSEVKLEVIEEPIKLKLEDEKKKSY